MFLWIIQLKNVLAKNHGLLYIIDIVFLENHGLLYRIDIVP
jgi:hypothetical protein